MPQSNRRISQVDLRGDMSNYYRGSVVTYHQPLEDGGYVKKAALVQSFEGNDNELCAGIRTMSEGVAEWSSILYVPFDSLNVELPPLGSVKIGADWIHLVRSPQRRMRKGYNEESIHVNPFELLGWENDYHSMDERIIQKVWFGCPDRLATNVVLERKGIYFKSELVANVSDDGAIIYIPNKEKLGEFVCKLLANNWEEVRSKHSNLTLP